MNLSTAKSIICQFHEHNREKPNRERLQPEEVGHFPRDMLVQSKLILQGLYGVTNFSLNPTYKDDKYGIFFGISLKPNKFSLQNQCRVIKESNFH